MKKSTTKSNTTTANPLEDRLKTFKEVESYTKAMIYGRSGTGKTTLAGSFPQPVFYMDVRDLGTDSVVNILSDEKNKVFEIESWADFQEAYWYLKSTDKYKTVIIDNVTQLQDLCLKMAKGGSDKVSKTSRQAWGDVAENMKSWILNYRDLPMNVVFIAQDRLDADDGDSIDDGDLIPEVGPAVIPSVSKILNACVDIIVQTFIREHTVKVKKNGKTKSQDVTQFCGRVGPHPIFMTKFRLDKTVGTKVPQIIVDPSYKKFINLKNGKEQ